MPKLAKITIGLAIALLGIGAISGAVMGLSLNPLTWLAFAVGCGVSLLIVWYGLAIAAGVDWE